LKVCLADLEVAQVVFSPGYQAVLVRRGQLVLVNEGQVALVIVGQVVLLNGGQVESWVNSNPDNYQPNEIER